MLKNEAVAIQMIPKTTGSNAAPNQVSFNHVLQWLWLLRPVAFNFQSSSCVIGHAPAFYLSLT